MTTLAQWLALETPDTALASVIASMASAGADIAATLRMAPITGDTGLAGATNVQGEAQKALDIISNDIVLAHLRDNPKVSLLVSEEMDDAVELSVDAPFIVATDPLDGSSNLDVNVTVGTIFSVLPTLGGPLQKGTAQVAAGYIAYGHATTMVLRIKGRTSGFALDTSGEWIEIIAEAKIPDATGEFAINTARERFWDAATAGYVRESIAGETGPAGKRYNMRWVGSMVADMHRILMRGGIFLYPLDSETVSKGGRLRLLYEANPMAWLAEGAGGRASTGTQSLLSVQPTSIHQRIPVILGSAEEVRRVEAWYAKS
ncbi:MULTISPECIES: class 1 fructose-bisphosphatase [unclassified Devosia]|uniref:class 1 fructose-bisphosphatase n=1 Tax=unclassified Devosia TaxID=196773 RepID=UPI00145E2759|nr:MULTISPECIES: class 1 fructose-bisphosphatase [unclassified Devosia]MBJ6987363.1 class 1 fructose-bisphosphatase [Devosia sp. MC521]MBJ7578072.1 class 1 fructose-bisphosphatase [Devosia sp. MC532]QMW63537.1 class 1 fructose-bisphosphatase [Devosia sp. MC521]